MQRAYTTLGVEIIKIDSDTKQLEFSTATLLTELGEKGSKVEKVDEMDISIKAMESLAFNAPASPKKDRKRFKSGQNADNPEVLSADKAKRVKVEREPIAPYS